uniref:Reverse transcriptase domain-containing protein n=1 Tax=Oryzias latipes TaxID=8090 RepID=A0A3B3HFX9_ORYLA
FCPSIKLSAESAVFFAKHHLFTSGNKPGRLLARLARGRTAPTIISSLKDYTNTQHFKSKNICNIMKKFFQNLYTSECQNASTASFWKHFLDGVVLPSLSEEKCRNLGRPITANEVMETINSRPNGKAPGPDGFGPLTKMFAESGMRGCLPPTLNLAHISLILKKDKPAYNCASYRPISLLGTDIKILAKLLVRRLELVLPTLINPDQTGFIKNRYSHSNVRRLLNIIHFSQYSRTRALILSLYTEKAFDRVEWEYLFDTLDKFGLGPDFINWIHLLYRFPTARIRVNGYSPGMSCPLSPLLFALALEPLAETIRHHKNLSGVTLGNTEHKISLYANDISGYKINFEKSEALPLFNFGDHTTLVDFPFKWSLSGFIYVGIRASASIKDMYKLNFTTTVKSVKNDLNRWFDLPLSCMGRISLIKMNALPRLLYPMQMLPFRINTFAILDIQRSISRFVWHGKRPRLKMRTLQLPVNKGGQALPNFLYYNWACHARIVYGWLKHFLNPEEHHVDAWSCAPHSIKFAFNKS